MSEARRRVLAILLCLPLLAGGCALLHRHLEAPRVTLKGITPDSASKDPQAFICRVLLENPNDDTLRVVSGQVTLDLGDFAAGRGETVESFTLPPYGSKEVDLRVTLDLQSALSGALHWLASGNKDLDYTLRGYVDLDVAALGRLPFKSKGKVNVEQVFRQLPGLLRRVPAPDKTAPGADATT